MSIPRYTNNQVNHAPLSKPIEFPSFKIDIDMVEALDNLAENPTLRGCAAVSKMAQERKRTVKLPTACQRYFEELPNSIMPTQPKDGAGPSDK